MPSLQEWVNGCTRDGRDLTRDPRRAVYAARHPEITPLPCVDPKPLPPPNPQKQHPLTILQRAVSLATVATKTVAKAATTGVAYLPEAAILERLAICRACDQFNADTERCKLCGCGCTGGANFANKLAHVGATCPALPPRW